MGNNDIVKQISVQFFENGKSQLEQKAKDEMKRFALVDFEQMSTTEGWISVQFIKTGKSQLEEKAKDEMKRFALVDFEQMSTTGCSQSYSSKGAPAKTIAIISSGKKNEKIKHHTILDGYQNKYEESIKNWKEKNEQRERVIESKPYR